MFSDVTTVGAGLDALATNVVPAAAPVTTGNAVAVSRTFQTKLSLAIPICGVVA